MFDSGYTHVLTIFRIFSTLYTVNDEGIPTWLGAAVSEAGIMTD